jgi:hypothetical protein
MWRGHFAAVFNRNEVPHTHIYITRLSKIKINKYHLLVSINMNSDIYIYMVCRCFSNFLRYSFVDVHRDIKPAKENPRNTTYTTQTSFNELWPLKYVLHKGEIEELFSILKKISNKYTYPKIKT